MDPELTRRIEIAVAEGVAARSSFYAAIDLPDEQQLMPPASDEQLASFEQSIGRVLPPSYRSFLALHNGWRMVDAVTDLLSTNEMRMGRRAQAIREWQLNAAKWGDQVGGFGVVIGYSDYTASRIILDPQRVDARGEWTLFENYKDEDVEYESFLEWLERSVHDYVGMVSNPTAEPEDS